MLPRSDTTDFGIPCSQITSLTKIRARSLGLKGCFNGTKWAYLDNRSTMTQIVLELSDGGDLLETEWTACSVDRFDIR